MGKRNRRRRRWEEDESELGASADDPSFESAPAAAAAETAPDAAPISATTPPPSPMASSPALRRDQQVAAAPSVPPPPDAPDAFAIDDDDDEMPEPEPAASTIPPQADTASAKPRAMAERLPPNAGMHPEPPSPLRSTPAAPARTWTREPVLLALLLVGLIVLAFDTYFTIRLTGLSDRLNAMATKPLAIASTTDRPWVGPESIRTASFATGGQPITTLHIVNSGRAPAMELRSNTVGSLRAANTPPPPIPAVKGPLANTAILFPNAGGDLTFFANTRALTAEEAGNVQSGQYVLWLAGRLDYRDAKGKDHLTTFRYRYDPKLASFAATPEGNAAN